MTFSRSFVVVVDIRYVFFLHTFYFRFRFDSMIPFFAVSFALSFCRFFVEYCWLLAIILAKGTYCESTSRKPITHKQKGKFVCFFGWQSNKEIEEKKQRKWSLKIIKKGDKRGKSQSKNRLRTGCIRNCISF